MTYRRFLIFTIVVGIIFIVLLYNYFHQGLAIIIALFSILSIGAGFVVQRAYNKQDTLVEQYGEADILNRMWFPLQDELTDVVSNQGRVTEAASAWTTAPGLSKRETPRAFYRGMEEYVGQRSFVASLAGGDLATEESRQQLVAEQQGLLSKAQELLERVDKEIRTIPGSETIVRRPRKPRPAAQRSRSTATGPSAATTQPTRMYRGAQAQSSTTARTTVERPAPSRPAPVQQRITATPTRPEPTITAPAPRVPEPPPPPSAPPAPSPVTASVPEPVEPVNPPEPVAATPVPSEPEPVPQPSKQPDDLRLDVASVCDELFNSQMMSYATNRLFGEQYKDATVRWRGTARRASTYSYDFEFGDGGGTKAELDVYEVKQQYGSRTVKAFVQLPVEAAEVIGARLGEDIEFEGRLMACEGSARRLYVAEARMVD